MDYLRQNYWNYVPFWAELLVSKREHHITNVQSESANRHTKLNQNAHALSKHEVFVIKEKHGTANAVARYNLEHG